MAPQPITENTLFYGDNLPILREYIASRIQILTVADLVRGTEVKMPPAYGTFKQAQKVREAGPEQAGLGLGGSGARPA